MRAKEHWQLALMVRTVPVLGTDVGKVARVEPPMSSAVFGEAFPVMCVSRLCFGQHSLGQDLQCGNGRGTPEKFI